MKTIRPLIVLCVAAGLLAGCRSDDPLAKFVTAVDVCSFNYVSSQGRSAVVMPEVGYAATFDDENRTASLTVSNFAVSAGDTPVTLMFDDVEWTYRLDVPGKARMIKADELIPSNVETSGGITLKDVTIVYFEASAADENHSRGFYIHYFVNGVYEVTAFPYAMQSTGATRVRDEATGAETVDYDTEFALTLDPDAMTASMIATGLDGPVESLRIEGMGLVLSNKGFSLSQKERTSWQAVPSGPDTEISDITVTADESGAMEVEFVLTVAGSDYRVTAFLYSNLNFSK